MIHVIEPKTHLSLGNGPFRIRRIRPGLGMAGERGNGFGPLGLVDRAHLSAGLVVDMHEHRDDEIVSYLRSGTLTHEDSDGNRENVTRERLMVMNAGSGFSHEERMPEGEDIHMLQIFLRPREADLEPMVQFAPLEERARTGMWRALVRPDDDLHGAAPTTVRQDVHILDAHVMAGERIAIPHRADHDQWLYVFDGTAALPDGTSLETGAAVAVHADSRLDAVAASTDIDLVLFEIARNATYSMAGSLSRGR